MTRRTDAQRPPKRIEDRQQAPAGGPGDDQVAAIENYLRATGQWSLICGSHNSGNSTPFVPVSQHFSVGDKLFRLTIDKVDTADIGPEDNPVIALGSKAETGNSVIAGAPGRAGRRIPPQPPLEQAALQGADETRTRLLAATIALLKERGFSNFRIADAADLAGFSRGAQTHHFATREKLIDGAIEDLFDKAVRAVDIDPGEIGEHGVVESAADHVEAFFHADLYRITLNMLIAEGTAEDFAAGVREISARNRGSMDRPWVERFLQFTPTTEQDRAEDAFGALSTSLRGLAVQEWLGDEPGDPDAVRALSIALTKRALHADAAKD